MPTFEKYMFLSSAFALRGSVRKPIYQDLGEHLALSTEAGVGTRASAVKEAFNWNDYITYDSARTEIIAEQTGDYIYESFVLSQVNNLRVGGFLEIEELTCKIKAVYDASQYPQQCNARILPTGSAIRNMRIHGKEQDLRLPDAFCLSPEQQADFFRGGCADNPAFQPGFIPEPIPVPGFGTIYYAEWVWNSHKDGPQQTVNMLRLALGSGSGGSVDSGGGTSGGNGYPPTT